MPPLWDPPSEATQLEQDSGRYFRDQNAARHPKHPIEPAVKITLSQNPELDTGGYDVFACTSTLGSLLRFLKNHDKPFRFTVEAVGNTIFFVRRENAPGEVIAGPKGYGPTGHGHVFPERYTRWQTGTEGSVSHQRIISYDFAGLKFLVRFEADGYLDEELGQEVKEDASTRSGGERKRASDDLEIDNVKVRSGGRLIPQHAVFELKTRGSHKRDEDHLADNLPRMWTAQIPFFVLALHKWGLFTPEEITIQDIREDVKDWQETNQDLLHQYSNLLKRLVALARDPDFGKYEVCLSQPGVLEIRKQGGTVFSPLSSPLTWIWGDCDGSESDLKSDGVAVGAEEDQDAAEFSDDDDEFAQDFTACSESCDYCGRCKYKLR